MSSTAINKTNNKDLLPCRTCLATDRRLYSLHEHHLLESYKNLLGSEMYSYDNLPQYICNYCAILLLKINRFRRNCILAQKYLEDTSLAQSNLTPKYMLSLQKSTTNFIDIVENEMSESISCYYEETYDSVSEEFNYTEHTEENDSKVFADIIKHEIDTTINPIPIKRHKNSQNKTLKSKNLIKIDSKLNLKNSNLKRDSKSTQNIKQRDGTKKRSKYFETEENMRGFEKEYNVEVMILSPEQQKKDVLDRKLSSNYLHSLYKCELCFKGVMDEDSLNKHILYQHDSSRGPIICEYCSFRYKDKRGLNQHLKSHRLKFACKQCPYVSRTTFNAKEHHKMHTGHIHKCRHCGKSYEKLSSHLTHLRIQHPSDFIWCNICGEAFIGEFGLNAHKKRAHRHLNLPSHCGSCETNFVSEAALSRHTSFESCSLVSCVHCGDCFNKTMELRNHLLEKHRNRKVYVCEKGARKHQELTTGPPVCSTRTHNNSFSCNKTFSRQSLHSAHYRRAHVDLKDKRKVLRPWVCEVCGKTLPNKSVLQYHQRTHTGERPHQCTQCHKSFTMRKLLQSHLRVHTSDRPYTCKLCPKAFKGLSALRAHQNVHSGGQRTSTINGQT